MEGDQQNVLRPTDGVLGNIGCPCIFADGPYEGNLHDLVFF